MNKNIFVWLLIVTFSTQSLFGQDQVNRSLTQHVTILASDSMSGRAFGFPEKALAVDYITKQFQLAGFKPVGDNFVQDFIEIEGLSLINGKNIIGFIEGSDPVLKNEYIVVGAHYDHMGWKEKNGSKIIYNGADDNASGVATIIETGKILYARKDKLKRSIIIAAFDGEEAGLIGSSAFVTSKSAESLNIKSMFSVDMVGMFSKNNGIELVGLNSIKKGEDFARKIAVHEDVSISKTSDRIEMQTDTWSFGKKNIPAIYVSTGLLSPYHKPEDDSNLLDYAGMGKVVKLLSEIVYEMANMDRIDPEKRFIRRSINPIIMTGWMLSAGNNHDLYKSTFYNSKPAFSVQTGITVQFRLTGHITLQPSLLYEMTGSRTENGIMQIHSVAPHLDLLISTLGKDMSKPVLSAILGSYWSHNLAATGKGAPDDFKELYSSQDFGIKTGIGLRYIKTQVNYYYKFGLNKINLGNDMGDIYNRGSYLSVIRYF
jgi:aminopeptidase YwaD